MGNEGEKFRLKSAENGLFLYLTPQTIMICRQNIPQRRKLQRKVPDRNSSLGCTPNLKKKNNLKMKNSERRNLEKDHLELISTDFQTYSNI